MAEEKERYTKYMTVDYMSSEQSMSESEGENAQNGYESPDVERPEKKVFSVSTLPWRSPELNSGHAQPRQKVNAAKECKSH